MTGTADEPTLLILARQHPKGRLVLELAEFLQKRDGTAPHVAHQIALALADTVDFFPETTLPKRRGPKRRAVLAHLAEIDRVLEEQPSSMASRLASIADLKVGFDDDVERRHQLDLVDRALGLQVTGSAVLTREERIRELRNEVGRMTDSARTAEEHAQAWQRKAEQAEADMKRNLAGAETWKLLAPSIDKLVRQLGADVGMEVSAWRTDARQLETLAGTVRGLLRVPDETKGELRLTEHAFVDLGRQLLDVDLRLGARNPGSGPMDDLVAREQRRKTALQAREEEVVQLRQDRARVSADRAHLEDLYRRAVDWLVSVDEAIGVPVSTTLLVQEHESQRRAALVRTQALGVWLSNLARNLEMEIPEGAEAFTVFLATLARMVTAKDPDELAALRTSLAEAREKLARISHALA